MSRCRRWIAALAIALVIATCAAALAEEISTTVVMRVSHMTQSAIVNVGEDLSLEVNIDGVAPDSYRWYFEGAEIPGADQRVYNIVNAQVSDSGVYRLEAFDADGKMLVSMDITARVIDDTIPKSGDDSLPVGAAAAAFVLAAGAMALLLRRRARV